MTLVKRTALATALALLAIGVHAASATAGLHTGPLHAVQEFSVFQGGSFGLSCDGHFEGEITDGAWNPTAEGFITTYEINQCNPSCYIHVGTPLHVEFSDDGHVVIEDYHLTWACFGTAFHAPIVEGTMDCAGHLTFENQPFAIEGTSIIAAAWTAEWHVTGIENEKCA